MTELPWVGNKMAARGKNFEMVEGIDRGEAEKNIEMREQAYRRKYKKENKGGERLIRP